MDKKNLLEYLLPGASIDFLKKPKKVLDFVCKLLMFTDGPYYAENQRLL